MAEELGICLNSLFCRKDSTPANHSSPFVGNSWLAILMYTGISPFPIGINSDMFVFNS